MRRDPDYLRELLLRFEDSQEYFLLFPEYKDSDDKELHHVHLLCDVRFIEKISRDGYRLTSDGHDFLAATRDEGLWQKTKTVVAETGGSATIEIMKALATGFLKKKIAQHTDIEL